MAQAGCRKPLRREQARGPQHEVKPAASTELQPESRAAHVTAKATSRARQSGDARARGLGGVRGAARVQGDERNTRGPSARPGSGQGASYKPKAKASACAAGVRGGRSTGGSSRRTTRREGRGPALVALGTRVSARAWPARPVPTTPTGIRSLSTHDNLGPSYGRVPSDAAGATRR